MAYLSDFVGGWAPVLLVFKDVYLNPQWMEFVPDDGMVIVDVSENGWITEELKLPLRPIISADRIERPKNRTLCPTAFCYFFLWSFPVFLPLFL